MKINLPHKILETISEVSHNHNIEAYVVGGYVRDAIMKRNTKDIDIVAVGSGIELAEAVAKKIGLAKVNIFKNFGTAQINYNDQEIEFVGARKESYDKNSRKPKVENGSLIDDLSRRDFTINALAASLSPFNYGEVIDIFDGLSDINNKVIKTPLESGITFSDDPLRMMRAIRFSSQLKFNIESETLKAITDNSERIIIISMERITDEFNKILLSEKPSIGINLLYQTNLLNYFLPELIALKGTEYIEGKGHKDNFGHSIQVVDQIAKKTNDLWLRWAALLHDIGKPATKQYVKSIGWTFHNHEIVGAKMIPDIFKRLRLPLNEKMKYVKKLVSLHLRPMALTEENISDSAIRRLLFDADNVIDDLMLLAESDITSKNENKVKLFKHNFNLVRQKMLEVEEKDKIRNWQPPISGEEIMSLFNLPPCKEVGILKNGIKEAILQGDIENSYDAAKEYIFKMAAELKIYPNKLK